MILYPAIDILGGHAVRLRKGDFDASKVYDQDPLAAARRWVQEGAEHLHVVDLDGARAGHPVNLEHVRRVTAALDVPVQLGGGMRTTEAIAQALAAGVERVILGTAAFTDPDLLERALAEHGPRRVLVSVDVRGGRVTTAGWTETTAMTAAQVVASLRERGVGELVYTDVDRDGMLEGPDLEEVRTVARAVHGRVVYSGGIGALADLEGLAALGEQSLTGVIVGKALYEERFTVPEARAALG
ncbi:MAG TPA: 1-(5-phosphoribosyl)-5-[(5-phosphoribosylamino)methylideneamino]imidazole-4-carboxamide isomerase [Solirubrobacteraceae bacterium]|jgi:phosphoribosylformimino-5-aminoimidazole carboxamide ribotide isomerase|nr:1-(5-phosphoribosyl)-5-[(5-phosphoribosylamino)methylideneamino]imidazole-4-carboxamide isomerase [Solirubrobacteraceae bacterium]